MLVTRPDPLSALKTAQAVHDLGTLGIPITIVVDRIRDFEEKKLWRLDPRRLRKATRDRELNDSLRRRQTLARLVGITSAEKYLALCVLPESDEGANALEAGTFNLSDAPQVWRDVVRELAAVLVGRWASPEIAVVNASEHPGRFGTTRVERRQALRDRRLRQNWGRFAGLAKALSNEPQSTTAWAKGAEGERTTARILEENAGEEVTFLHDLGVPRSSANIDHIAVIGSHVFVIDSKAWEGTIQIRQVGGFFNSTPRLYVGRRDGTKAIEGLARTSHRGARRLGRIRTSA